MLNGERVPTFFTFIRNTSPGSVAGIPGISLPAAMTAAGLPLGLELDGPAGDDARLLALAAAVEARAAEDAARREPVTSAPMAPRARRTQDDVARVGRSTRPASTTTRRTTA